MFGLLIFMQWPIYWLMYALSFSLLTSYLLQLGSSRVHKVRTRGGNFKQRALRLDTGNFAWASEGVARKTRIADVVYNASNNELVRT